MNCWLNGSIKLYLWTEFRCSLMIKRFIIFYHEIQFNMPIKYLDLTINLHKYDYNITTDKDVY